MTKRLLAVMAILGLLTVFAPAAAVQAVSGAGFTTDNPNLTNECLHGPDGEGNAVNCNLYAEKADVWINGGPSGGQNHLSDGTYFFAVLVPGGQPDPNDGGAKNLSDTSAGPGATLGGGDASTNRQFTVVDGKIAANLGTHLDDDGGALGTLIQLVPYDDTTNPGGVYILAICQISSVAGTAISPTPTVQPQDCKYDAFKVRESDGGGQGAALVVTKTVDASADRTFDWDIAKSVDRTSVNTTAATYTFNYTILLSHDSGTLSDFAVSGVITVSNPNDFDVTGVDVTDELNDDPATVCAVTGGTDATIPANDDVDFAYSCDPADDTATTNTATASWAEQGSLLEGSADFVLPFDWTYTQTDECVTLTDAFGISGSTPSPGSLGTFCANGSSSGPAAGLGVAHNAATGVFTLTYSRTVTVPRNGCATYDNTAEFTTTDSGATDSADATVTVCGPVTGGFTIGYWSNKNGQAQISGAGVVPTTTTCRLTPYLRTYAPFQDLSATATCNQVASYAANVIKVAKCADTGPSLCNSMLKAQMLATALSAYFTPSLGTTNVNTTNWSAAFGGATCITVNNMLSYAASQSNPGGATWYGNVKSLQVLAKSAFDAINNNVAIACVP